MAIHRGDDGVECVVSSQVTITPQVAIERLQEALRLGDTITFVPVVNCKDCKHCRLLNDGISWDCADWEQAFYAPEYNAATWYCANGKRKEN